MRSVSRAPRTDNSEARAAACAAATEWDDASAASGRSSAIACRVSPRRNAAGRAEGPTQAERRAPHKEWQLWSLDRQNGGSVGEHAEGQAAVAAVGLDQRDPQREHPVDDVLFGLSKVDRAQA